MRIFAKLLAASLAAIPLLAGCTASDKEQAADFSKALELKSPDGGLTMKFTLSEDGTPMYSLDYQEKNVILPSSLGYEIRGDRDYSYKKGAIYGAPKSLHDGFSLLTSSTDSLDEVWHPVMGEESSVRNNYRELLVALKQDSTGILMNIRFRLYDDGLGLRYEFPQQDFSYFTIKEELTSFAMAGDHTAWWIPGDYDNQEYNYNESRLSEIPSVYKAKGILRNASQQIFSDTGVQTALQMRTDDGLYINIHEAGVVDYPTTSLNLDEKTLTFTTWLTPDAVGWKGFMQTPCKSPWRTVMVTDSAVKTLSSRLILNLNDPCAYEDVSWIHPTKYMGVWWEMICGKSKWSYTSDYPTVQIGVTDYSKAKPHGLHGANNENVRRYIDFAAANGFDAILVEGWNIGWEGYGHQKDYVFDFLTPYPDFDIEALNRYAHSKGIRLIMHHETSASVRNYERHMEEAYSLMNKYGYDAVKSGYVGDIIPRGWHHYTQDMINHYLYCVTQAASHHIMVNAHEAVRPTGLCRTYPNLIGNEAAMGTEYRGIIEASHVTVLPFTRLQGGPMDYTPGIFEMDLSKLNPKQDPVQAKFKSTICKQLALYVTMYSPLQMAADLPENYQAHMDAFQFIKDVALDWEKSVYLAAEPGDYVVVARQAKKSSLDAASKGVEALPDGMKGYVNGATAYAAGAKDVWFVGGVTDENARDIEVNFGFLPEGKTYQARFYVDGPDASWESKPQSYSIFSEEVSSATIKKIHMATSGGFAIELKEK